MALTHGSTAVRPRSPRRLRSHLVSLLAVFSVATACDCGGVTADELSLTPSTPTVAVGETLAFEAHITRPDGSRERLDGEVTWASSEPGVATIDAQGNAQALRVGSTHVTAAYNDRSVSTLLTVTEPDAAPQLRSLVVELAEPSDEGATPSIPSGRTRALRAVGTFSDDTTADVTAQVGWSSEQEEVATVSNDAGAQGRVQGQRPGTARIVATQGAVSASLEVEVTEAVPEALDIERGDVLNAPGTTRQLTARRRFSDGTLEDVPNATWAVGAGSAVTVDPTGLATVTGPIGAQQEITATDPETGFSTTFQLFVRRYVYVSTNRQGDFAGQMSHANRGILSFTASDADGAVTEIPDSFISLEGGASAYGGAMHPTGRFVYFATTGWAENEADYSIRDAVVGQLEAFRVDLPTGRLSPIQRIDLAAAAIDVAIDPSGRFLAAIINRQVDSSSGLGSIVFYRIDAETGALTELARRSDISGFTNRRTLRQVAFNPVHPYLYVASNDFSEPSGGVFAMTYGDDGLHPVPGADAFSDPGYYNFISGVSVHPSGEFLFISNLSSAGGFMGSVAVDPAEGSLSTVNVLFDTAVNVERSDIDPSGRNLYVAWVHGVGHLRVAASTGELSLAPVPRYEVAPSGFSKDVTVESTGRFLYLARSLRPYYPEGPGQLVTYRIGADGALTETGQVGVSSYGVVTSP